MRSTAAALRAAETLGPVQEGTFELRLLRVPALYLVALWRHASAGDDLFMPLDPAPAPFEARRAYTDSDFAKLTAGLARDAIETQRASERPAELAG